MRFDAPFTLGPFAVDAEGRLTTKDPGSEPTFHFRSCGRLIHVRLDRTDAGAGRLTLRVALARVRSTAGTPDATVRPRSFALLHWLQGILPPSWRATLLADHRFWLETDVLIELPITATRLISELTGFALELAPYFELMDEMGLTVSEFRPSPLPVAGGAVATLPS